METTMDMEITMGMHTDTDLYYTSILYLNRFTKTIIIYQLLLLLQMLLNL